MKIRITMKDPDGFYESVEEGVNDSLESLGLSEAEKDAVREVRVEEIKGACKRWFEYDEYLTVEVDTEAKTCTVVERGK